MSRPNILFVFSDQHRACDLGCYGNPAVISPHFDAFAAAGRRFTNCVSNSPVCVPIRGTLLTGYHATRHRAATNDLPVDTSLESIAGVLNKADYRTGYIGKWHLGGVPRNRFIDKHERMGFTEWKVANCTHQYHDSYYWDEENDYHRISGYEPDTQTDLAREFIQRGTSAENPWALYLSWGPPHAPYGTAPDEFKALYADADIELPANVPERILQDKLKNAYDTREKMREQLRGYYAHISAIDACFGRLLETLEATGQADNTIIVYTSDHGDLLGSHGYGKKQAPWAESVNVPLLVRWPGHVAPGVTDGVIGLVDLPVTLAAMAGTAFKDARHGRDLSAFIRGSDADALESAYLHIPVPAHQALTMGRPEWYGVKTRDWTYAVSPDKSFEVLYHDTDDPLQMNNLAGSADHASVRDDLRRMMDAHIQEAGDEMIPWRDYLRKNGFAKKWNTSQRWMGRPEFELVDG